MTGTSPLGTFICVSNIKCISEIICRDNWAKTTSPNKNVKIYIGAPASSTAAGSGYVAISSLAGIIQQTKAQYSSFGGVMFWDASQAYGTFS